MKVLQSFSVDADVERVWTALGNVQLVVSCVPGAEIMSVSDDGREVAGRIRAKVGPITAVFMGTGTVTRDDELREGSVEGQGADQASNSRAKIRMDYSARPEEEPGRTQVEIAADVTLSGALAQFGKGPLIKDIAAALTRDFADNLQEQLKAGRGGPPPRQKTHLNPLALLWSAMVAQIRRIFRADSD